MNENGERRVEARFLLQAPSAFPFLKEIRPYDFAESGESEVQYHKKILSSLDSLDIEQHSTIMDLWVSHRS